MSRTALLPALLLLLGPAFVACGGDDESSAPAPAAEALSKADFVAEANEICASGNGEILTALEEFPDEPSDEELEQAAEEVLVPNLQQQHDDIAALGVPEGDEDAVQAILDALQSGIDAVEEDAATLLASDDDPFDEANDLAGSYGLEECS